MKETIETLTFQKRLNERKLDLFDNFLNNL
jgi:hypothetical protein